MTQITKPKLIHKKDFTKWHEVKTHVNNNPTASVFFNEREVWYCHLGENVGFEMDGKGDSFLRPVVVVRKFNKETCWVVPLTSQIKASLYYHQISFGEGKQSSANLSQFRLIDSKRLSHAIGKLSHDAFDELIDKIVAILKKRGQ